MIETGGGWWRSLMIQIGVEVRPYLIALAVDFMVSATLWVALFFFKLLTKWLSIEGWPAAFIVNLHGAGAVAAFGVFAVLLSRDLYLLHRGVGRLEE